MSALKDNYQKRRESILNLSSIQHALASEISTQLLTGHVHPFSAEAAVAKPSMRRKAVNNSITIEIDNPNRD